MGPAVNISDIVSKSQAVFGIAGVILHRYLAGELGLGVFFGEIHHLAVQGFFAFVKVPDKGLYAVGEFEYFLFFFPVVLKYYFDAGIQIGQLPDSFGQGVVLKCKVAEDFFIGDEFYFSALFVCRADFFYRAFGCSFFAFEVVVVAVFIDVRFEPFAQGVDNAYAYPVQNA